MKYRLTVTLGRDSIDRSLLLDEARRLDDYFARRLLGGNGPAPDPVNVDVLVDPIKAALQLVLTVEAPDALNAAILGLARINSGFEGALLSRPTSVVAAEAEAIPGPTGASIAPEIVHHQPYKD